MAVSLGPLPYSRRVSFNNLHDEATDPASKFYTYSMAEPSPHEFEVARMFSYSMAPARKRLRLPDPPLKLILKNRLSPAQLHHNLQHAMLLGVLYHGDLNDLATHPPELVPRLELATVVGGAPLDLDLELDTAEAPEQPATRRKLYLQMTDEELMALDPQFAKPKTLNLDNFKFDATTTYYQPARRGSTSTAAHVPKQVLYPSLNENNYKSMALTMKHVDYDADDAAVRTLLAVVLGRKHTWNTLDWLLLTDETHRGAPGFLQHGDYLVVAALVPLKFFDECRAGRRKSLPDDRLYAKCDSILRYILELLPDTLLRLKITVELVIDTPPPDPMAQRKQCLGTKFMLLHLFKQYQPCLVVVGNKSTNLNFKYPIRMNRRLASVATGLMPGEKECDEYLIKLLSYLVKYLLVPLICVGNLTVYHRKTDVRQPALVTFSDAKPPRPDPHGRKSSAVSECSIESYAGAGHNDSGSISSDDAHLDEDIAGRIADLYASPDEARFGQMLAAVSLLSLAQLKHYLDLINDDSVDKLPAQVLNSKVHQAYLQQAQGRLGLVLKTLLNGTAKAYKVKSLISYSEEDEKKNEKMIHDKKLKKSISRSLAASASLGGPGDKQVKKKKSFLQKLGLKG